LLLRLQGLPATTSNTAQAKLVRLLPVAADLFTKLLASTWVVSGGCTLSALIWTACLPACLRVS
jgi:hypothetical protein